MINPQELVDSLPADSWIRTYLDAFPTAEMPTSYIMFAALGMIGSCLGRRCYYLDDFRQLLPMLNLLFIGPSGIGKSSSMTLARMFLLEKLPAEYRPQFIGGASTKEKLHEDLLLCPHAVLYASELAAFFNKAKYMEPLIPYITELLDYGPVEVRTKSGKLQRIPEPSVTVVGGSTKDWLSTALPDTAIGGGFLPRFLIITEDQRRQRVADARMAVSTGRWKELVEIREGLWQDFLHIVTLAEGRIGWADFQTADTYSSWYVSHQPTTGYLAPFEARAAEMVKRLSMLVALSCKRDAITEADLKAAICMYRYTEQKLQEVIVPTSQVGKLITSVLQCIPLQGATIQELKRAMRNQCTAQDVSRFIESLLQSGDVELREGRLWRMNA